MPTACVSIALVLAGTAAAQEPVWDWQQQSLVVTDCAELSLEDAHRIVEAESMAVAIPDLLQVDADVAVILARLEGSLSLGCPQLSVEAARALAEGSLRDLYLPKFESLPVDVGTELALNQAGLHLPNLRRVDVALAAVLVAGEPREMTLGIDELSDELVAAIGLYEMDLNLPGLTSLSPAFAEQLSSSLTLSLGGLDQIGLPLAEVLGRGDRSLKLNGLRSLTPELAAALCPDPYSTRGVLELNGLEQLSAEAAANLRGGFKLHLNGLKRLDVDVAYALGGSTFGFFLDGLQSFPTDVAESFVAGRRDTGWDEHWSAVSLGGIHSLSPGAAHALTDSGAMPLSLGVLELSFETATHLSLSPLLTFTRLETITPRAAQALVSGSLHRLQLDALTRLNAAAAGELVNGSHSWHFDRLVDIDEATRQQLRGIANFGSYSPGEEARTDFRWRRWEEALEEANLSMATFAGDEDAPAGENPPLYLLRLRAKIHRNLGDLPAALADVTRAIELYPNAFPLYRLRASLYEADGDYAAAFEDADRAIAIVPSSSASYYFRAQLKLSAGDIDGASDDCEQGRKFSLPDAALYRLASSVDWFGEQYSAATEGLELSLELDPFAALTHLIRAEQLHTLGKNDEALSSYTSAFDLAMEGLPTLGVLPSPEVLESAGDGSIPPFAAILVQAMSDREQDLQGAKLILNQLLVDYPGYLLAYHARAQIHGELDQADLALGDHATAARFAEQASADFRANRVGTALQHHLALTAIHGPTLGLFADPDNVQLLWNRHYDRSNQGDQEGAIRDLTHIYELGSNDWILARRAEAYQELQQWDLALADLELLIELDPENSYVLMSSFYFYKSKRSEQQGDLELAARDLTEAFAWGFKVWEYVSIADGDMETQLQRLADLKLQTGDFRGAAAALADLIAYNPWDDWAMASRGRALYLAGDVEAGLAELLRACEEEPNHSYHALFLAVLGGGFEQLDQREEAPDAWTQFIARYLRDELSVADLLAEAERIRGRNGNSDALCEAHGFVGMKLDAMGDAAGARRAYEACVATGVTTFVEYYWSVARLLTLDGGPEAPR